MNSRIAFMSNQFVLVGFGVVMFALFAGWMTWVSTAMLDVQEKTGAYREELARWRGIVDYRLDQTDKHYSAMEIELNALNKSFWDDRRKEGRR